MSATRDFQSQIASIMEVLANAAVAEICKVVDDGYAVVHLEMSQSHKENEFLRRKIKLLELQIAKFRAEKMKFSDGSISSRFGVRLINRHSLTPASGPSLQSKVRPVNRNTGINTVIDRSPINVNQDAASNCGAAPNNKSTEPKEEEEDLDLLIVKVEGAVGVDDTALSRDSVRPLEGSREISLPTTTKERDVSNATQPASNAIGHNLTEVSGSHTPAVADNLSETKIESVTPLYAPTGSDLRAEIPYMDLNEAPLAQEWTNVATNNISYTTVMDIDSQPGSRVSTTEQSIGHSSTRARMSAEVIEINSVSSGQEVRDRMTEWSEGRGDIKHVNGISTKEGVAELNSFTTKPRPIPVNTTSSNTQVAPAFQTTVTSPVSSNCASFSGVGIKNMCRPDFRNGITHRRPFQRPVSHFSQSSTAAAMLDRPFACGQCRKWFVLESDLKRHCLNHAREKQFTCPLCHKSFVCPSQLRVHQNVHTGERPFGCKECGRTFSHPSNLRRHQKLQHN